MSDPIPTVEPQRHYTWPFYLAAALLLGLVICVLAVKREADRVRMQKELQQRFPLEEKQP